MSSRTSIVTTDPFASKVSRASSILQGGIDADLSHTRCEAAVFFLDTTDIVKTIGYETVNTSRITKIYF